MKCSGLLSSTWRYATLSVVFVHHYASMVGGDCAVAAAKHCKRGIIVLRTNFVAIFLVLHE